MFTPTIVDQSQIPDDAILVVDVDYRATGAVVSGVIMADWSSNSCAVVNVHIDDVKEYEPGAFYKREMPCIIELLSHITPKLRCIVVDGYVHLGEDQHAGLGAHLYQELDSLIPVIGVAKTFFHGTPDDAKIYRTTSQKAIFVTAIGMDQQEAKANIAGMHGEFRIPSMLRYVDQCCRSHP